MARLTRADRIKMETLLNAGHSVQEVADELHVHRATIYREYNRGKYMHRNSDYTEEERYSSDLGQKAHDWYVTGKGRPLKVRNDIEYIKKLEQKILEEVSCNFNFTMSYRYDILIKTTLCTAVFYTVQTEQAGDFLGPGRK